MTSIDQRAGEVLADLVDRTPGIATSAAAVMIGGRIVLEHNAAEPLCACSTFKVAAASAVMALVQEGVVDLDQRVPEIDASLIFSDQVNAQEITLRQLLSHTSGLDDTEESSLDRVALFTIATRHSTWGCWPPRDRPASVMKTFCAPAFWRHWR